MSTGCTAVNALSGATSLSFSSNAYAASNFGPSDALTVSFTDSGAASGGNAMTSDSFSLSNYSETSFQTYNAADSTSHSAQTIVYSVAAGDLAANGLRVRLTTSYGQISNVVFSCTGSTTASSVATLSNLALSAGTLSPSFASGTTSYSASVANSVPSITVTPTTTDSHATVTVNGSAVPSGSASSAISLTAGATANIPVVVTAQDNTTAVTYTLAVTRAQAAPVANNVSQTVTANSTNDAITLSFGGGTPTSVAIASGPSHGSATASGTSITYTPTTGYSGADSFTYTATNASGVSSAATVSITVSAPTLVFSPASNSALPAGTVHASYTQGVAASRGQSPYTYSAAGLPSGLGINASNGTISGTPTAAGSFTVTVTATDANHATASATYTLAIAPPAPVAGAGSATVAANSSNTAIALALSGGTATSISIASAPTHGRATVSGTTIVYTPDAGYSGTDSLIYTATNASGSSSATINIIVSSPTLVFTPAAGALASGSVDAAYTQAVSAAGGTAPYRYSATGLPAGLAIAASSGTISGTPTASGDFTPTVTATDSAGATTAVSYTLRIAPLAPVASNVTATVTANSTNNAITLNVGGGAATAVAIVAAARHGVAAVSGTAITYTPNGGYSGADSFTYSATNASGTSSATVRVTVTAPRLTIAPVAGSTLNATLGRAYTQTLSVSGGTGPYRFAATALPAGLILDTGTGTISGTPTATGTSTFTVTASDANGVEAQAKYTMAIVGVAPVAEDHNVTLYAGQTATVNLSDGAAGGPFSAATIVNEPSGTQGTAKVSTRNGAYVLTFAAATQASGAVLIRYTLTNAWGTSTPATVTLQVSARPDPGKDSEVIGLLNAQAQSAEQFANAQIGNFNDRLEQLHDERTRHDNSFNVHVGLPQSPMSPQAQGAPNGQNDMHGADGMNSLAAAPSPDSARVPKLPHWIADDKLAVWTGGFVNFGTSDRDTVRLSHTLVGVSAGADYRFLPALVAGLGFGYGRDVSDVGSSGTESNGEAFSAAFYGSYHPGPVFVDGLLGFGHLDFDSRRFVTETGGYANGARAGDQVFGSLSSGYEWRSGLTLFAPYGRMQFSSTLLRHYSESDAGAFDLSYANQRLAMVSAVAGVRGEYGVPVSWGAVKLSGRLEYSHALTGTSTARLGYADTNDDAYAVTVLGLSENQLTAAVGVDFSLPFGLTTGLTYQGMFGMSDHTRNQEFMVHVVSRF